MPTVTPQNLTKQAYVQVQCGAYKTAQKGNAYAAGTIQLGAELAKNGTFGKVEIGAGTNLNTKLDIGLEFDLGKNMGLELTGKTAFNKNLTTTTSYVRYENSMNVNINGENKNITDQKDFNFADKDGYIKAGGEAKLNFKGKHGKFGIGVEGGYRKDLMPDRNIDDSYTINVKDQEIMQNKKINITENHSGGYITPTFTGELNLGKTGKWQAVLNANRYEGNAGIRYNF